MNSIKILLLVYLVLRIINFIPSKNLILKNNLYNFFIFVLILLLAVLDPILGFLTIIAIILNTNNESFETMLINISNNEIHDLTKTLLQKKIKNIVIEEENIKEENVEEEDIKKSNSIIVNHNIDEKNDCLPEFIISKEMLSKVQNNISNLDNLDLYPNETQLEDVNIQGVYDEITGYVF